MNRLAVVAALALGLGGSAQSGGEILFWTTSPIPSLRAMRPDGTHVRRIAGGQNAKRPSLSPDRRWVAFDGTPKGKPPLSDFDVQVVRVEGTQRRTVVATTDWELDAKWSRDGTRLSFSRMPRGADWRHSIVDLMKLVGIDSSLANRKALAQELGYTGDMNDSATMNVWLHKQVLRKLSENGGHVPANLID